MGQIAATDVTYTHQAGSSVEQGDRVSGVYKIQFGNGSLLYTNAGIPVTKGKLNCPASLEVFSIMDSSNADGYIYKYDYVNATIRMYYPFGAQTHAHSLQVIGSQSTAGAGGKFLYNATAGTGVFAMNDSGGATWAGGAAVATTGGVQLATLSAAAGSEVSTATAVSATTLYVRVSGW